ncbi:MAG: hypothetical protein M3T55_11855 [Pseudomonadota bacterium]|nr:hypothetical protein [Pseudomonadota bacterium]
MNTGTIAFIAVALAAPVAGGVHCQTSAPTPGPQVNFGLLGPPPNFASSYANGY